MNVVSLPIYVNDAPFVCGGESSVVGWFVCVDRNPIVR